MIREGIVKVVFIWFRAKENDIGLLLRWKFSTPYSTSCTEPSQAQHQPSLDCLSVFLLQQSIHYLLVFFTMIFSCTARTVSRCLNFALYFKFLGLVLSLYPQHGHQRPSHFRNISHIWHRFCPLAYLPIPTGFWALCLEHIPLHVIFT